MSGNTGKYHISIRIMHWSMALLILGMIAAGWYMAGLPKDDALKAPLTNLHKSFGTLALILFFVRLVIRLATKAPPLPETIPAIQRLLAHLGHAGLYVFMFIVPLSGYAMSNLYGYGVKMFGMEMPRLFSANKEFAALARESHGILPFLLLGLIALHVGAVVQHRFFEKPENDVLKRML